MIALSPEVRFQYCVYIILSHEGGLTDDKSDPGGITNYGISLRFLRAVGLHIDGDNYIDAQDVINLTPIKSRQIYRIYWWDKYEYEKFNSLDVVAKVFDLAVNMGAIPAHKLLQEAINKLGHELISIDGILGEHTFEAANSLDPLKLRQQLRVCAEQKYLRILAANPAMEWCKAGWMKRAEW